METKIYKSDDNVITVDFTRGSMTTAEFEAELAKYADISAAESLSDTPCSDDNESLSTFHAASVPACWLWGNPEAESEPREDLDENDECYEYFEFHAGDPS
jgi:hypothetical protein